jgi:tetratricopeptide (TPR) repeat protein
LSDIYYKVGLYDRSLYYLDEISQYCSQNQVHDQPFCATLTYNKAENFYRLGKKDSLAYYSALLDRYDDDFYDIRRLRLRLAYYQKLLAHQFNEAIPVIRTVLKDSTKYDAEIDHWHLAYAYYQTQQPDKARQILQHLVTGNLGNKWPQDDPRYYELLARIDERAGDLRSAHKNAVKALELSKKQAQDLARVSDISTDIRTDQVKNSYLAKTMAYERERMILIFCIVAAVLVTVIIAMFYYNAKQQRRYESLLYASKHEELAFINSHEVRKHLSNILGLCEILKDGSLSPEELHTHFKYLQRSAADLDEAIKSVEQKLSERH